MFKICINWLDLSQMERENNVDLEHIHKITMHAFFIFRNSVGKYVSRLVATTFQVTKAEKSEGTVKNPVYFPINEIVNLCIIFLKKD